MIDKSFEEKMITEIIEMLKTNLIIYYKNSDDFCVDLKKYCDENFEKDYKSLPYLQLLFFVEEVLADLINCPYLYDYRSLE